MKHGYFVKGYDRGQFISGRCETKAQVRKAYAFWMKSPHVKESAKKTLRVIELVEVDITDEVINK